MKIWTEKKLIEEGYDIWGRKNLVAMVREWNPLLE